MGGGHDGAGRELLRRLRDRGHHAQMVDFLDAFPLHIGWLVRAGYWLELRYAPWSYEATYRLWYLLPFVFQPLGALINLLTHRKVLRWVRQTDADVVVSTYPMASLVLGAARHVLGWTDEMPALMAAADALVQNAGGLTCMEAFAAGLPVVSFEPIAGHGKDNAEHMSEAGVAAYAAGEDELFPALDRATSLAGRSMTAKGKAMFAGDPTDDVVTLAASAAPDAAAERVAARRLPLRKVTAGVAALAATYAAFTAGVGAAAAHGIGIAHPHKAGSVYLAVRLGSEDLTSATLPDALRQANVTAIVPGRLAAEQPDGLRRLQSAGVSMANGGWGHRDRVHWGRARSDLMRAPKAIHAATGERPREFVPQRRIDGFDLASARLAHERVVVPSIVLSADKLATKLHAGQVVVIDARGETVDQLLHSLYTVEQNVEASGLAAAPLSQI